MKWLNIYLQRPFPRRSEEFKHAMISYSQFGEDLLVQELVGYDRNDIFYIDIGAFHPIIKSNTYLFYQRGGSGICIEPNPAARPLWRQYRPRDTFVGKGVIGVGSCLMTYRHNSASEELNHLLNDASEASTADLQIECTNIGQILKDHLPLGRPVDVLSIDCEGLDLDIIRTFPFQSVRPRVAIIEDFDYSEESEISALMRMNGYKTVSYAKISKLFVDNQVVS